MAEEKKKYVPPKIEIQEKNDKSNFFVRLCYGYVGRYKDTSKMTTREVIDEFLKKRGVSSPKEFFEKAFNRAQENKSSANKGNNDQQQKTGSNLEELKKLLLDDERIDYSRTVTKEAISKVIDCGKNGTAELTCRLFSDDSFGIGAPPLRKRETAFFYEFNKVGFTKSDLLKSGEGYSYEDGEVFYHECWHAIDHNYGDSTDIRSGLSNTYTLSSGKTFQDTLISEFSENVDIRKVKEEYLKDRDSYYKSLGYDRNQIIADYQSIEHQAQVAWSEEFNRSRSWESAEQKARDIRNSEKYIKARELYGKVIREHPAALNRKWGDFSDIISGATKDRVNFGMRHSSSYWKSDANKRGLEAFAEIASAKATNPKSYSLLKKYLPQTVQAFEEIYSKLEKGEIKSNGRPKYQK